MNAIIPVNPQESIEQAKRLSDLMRVMRKDVLRAGVDYGVIPGTDKPSLFKPGAERLCGAFGYNPMFEFVEKIEQWDTSAPLFNYTIRCRLIHITTGAEVATGIGSCNSLEGKYRWRWLWPNQVTEAGLDANALPFRTTKSGKKQYRIDNDDVFSLVNTLQKMACKRALVAAVLIGANASEYFTQDIEDLRDFGSMDVVEGEFEEVGDKPEQRQSVEDAPKPGNGHPPQWADDLETMRNLKNAFQSRFGLEMDELLIERLGRGGLYNYPDKATFWNQVCALAEKEQWDLIAYKATYTPNEDGSGLITFDTALKTRWYQGRSKLAGLINDITVSDWTEGEHELPFPLLIKWEQKDGYKLAVKVESLAMNVPF